MPRYRTVLAFVTTMTIAIALSLASRFAHADVIPPDYEPPPPPTCSPGARPQPNTSGRGHGGWGGCIATTCATDADCPNGTSPCREAALCVASDGIAAGPCGANDSCPGMYTCARALRCIGSPPAPAQTTSRASGDRGCTCSAPGR